MGYDPDYCPKASWFHVLCKDIEVDRDNSHIIDEHGANQENPLSQSSFSWLRSAYFMCWTRNPHKSVTLICFCHPPFLPGRLKKHLPNMWEQVVNNPFDLWVVVLHELFKQIDNQAWNLGNVFRGIEHVRTDQKPTVFHFRTLPIGDHRTFCLLRSKSMPTEKPGHGTVIL
jgi:hypothetical protein